MLPGALDIFGLWYPQPDTEMTEYTEVTMQEKIWKLLRSLRSGHVARNELASIITESLERTGRFEFDLELPNKAHIYKVTDPSTGAVRHYLIHIDDHEGFYFEAHTRGCAADAAQLFLSSIVASEELFGG